MRNIYKTEKFRKFLLFGLVGIVGTVINSGILHLLTTYMGVYYLVASIFATETAIVSNFLGNNLFTFKDKNNRKAVMNKFAKFQLISMTTIIGTVFVLWFLTSTFGMRYLLIWNFIAILVMFFANFFLNSKYTWKEKNIRKVIFIFSYFIFLVIFLSGTAFAALVAVSQMGYHPDQPKQVIVYLDAKASYFEILDVSGTTKARYNLQKALDFDNNEVNCQGNLPCKVGDFSDFKEEGEYYIKTQDGNVSKKFKISKTIFSDNLPILLDFFSAQKQQNSPYHADMHEKHDPKFTIMADGSFIMESSQAAHSLIRLGNSYRHNPSLFAGSDIQFHIRDYVEFLEGLQGVEIEEKTDGIGFRINTHVQPINAFIPGETALKELKIYSPGNKQSIATIPLVSLCGSEKDNPKWQQCIDNAAIYYKCQFNEPCLNLTYQDKTGVVKNTHNGFAVSKGWGYEFGCYVDIDLKREEFNDNFNPCLIFYKESKSDYTIQALTGFLMAIPAVDDYSHSEAKDLFLNSKSTYEFVKKEYDYKADSENAAYFGTSAFLMYDYTNEKTYLEEAYGLRDIVSKNFVSDVTHGNEFYWEEYIEHKYEIENLLKKEYKINSKNAEEFFRNKIFGDYKDKGPLSMSKNGERVYQLDPNIKFQNSRYILLEGLIASKTDELANNSEEFISKVATNQLAWITGMNGIQKGVAVDSNIESISFIFGIGDYPKEFHSRYLFDSGHYTKSNGKLIGARGTNLQFYDGKDYIYLDGFSNILGKEFGALGNGYNGEEKIDGFGEEKTFLNGKKHIDGWINGAFDIAEDNDVIFNYDDNIDTYEFTETTNEIVSTAVELFSYLDSTYNSKEEHNGPKFDNLTNNGTTIKQPLLNIITNPIANVKINNKEYGISPINISLDAGKYEVEAWKDGYKKKNLSVQLDIGQNYNLNITLEKISSNNESNKDNKSNIESSKISLKEVNNSNYKYEMLEKEKATFKVNLKQKGDVTWKIDGNTINTSISKTEHTFDFSPGIKFTDEEKIVLISAESGFEVHEWRLNVRNFIEAKFSPASGTDGSSLNIIIDNNLTNLSVKIENSLGIKEFVLNKTGNDWLVFINKEDFIEGNNTLIKLSGLKSGGTKFDYTFSGEDNINFIKTLQLPSSNENTNSGQSNGGSNGGNSGGSNSGSSSSNSGPEKTELIYLVVEKNVIGENETQIINLDAKSNRNIDRIELVIKTPSGEQTTLPLNLVSGSKSYGTWQLNSNFPVVGLYNIEKVKIFGYALAPYEFNISQRSFYVVSGNLGDSEILMIVYSVLDKSVVEEVSDVTLRLDARDKTGINKINAEIGVKVGKNEEISFILPLNMVSGISKYGTWEGVFKADQPDTTYYVRNVTLSNGLEEKTYILEDRSVYATSAIPGKLSSGANSITGFSVLQKVNDELRKPFAPVIAGFFVLGFIVLWIFVYSKINGGKKRGKNFHDNKLSV
ncbi:MAG: GtrA family protein [Nanoarchaeota archaeon]|nr:GtrA family protein [Nanoarchaeota archaeon]